MMMTIKEYVADRKAKLKDRLSGKPPISLAIVQVGDDEASNRYIRNKIKDCEEVGIKTHHYYYEESISQEELWNEINDLKIYYNGIIIQRPLPKHINAHKLDSAYDEIKDVDGFMPGSPFVPATAKGIIDYLEAIGFKFEGCRALVIGRSEVVGKPVAKLLLERDATVALCHSKTKKEHLRAIAATADLIICAAGRRNVIDAMECEGFIVDVGINFVDGKMVGDVANGDKFPERVTPVPGGVGLLTRLALLENVEYAAELQSRPFYQGHGHR